MFCFFFFYVPTVLRNVTVIKMSGRPFQWEVPTTLGIFFSSCFLSLITYVIYQRIFNSLASIPGPFLASISRLWLAQKYWRGDYHRTAMKLHATYGEIVRIAPNEVSLSDPDAIRTIYGQARFYKGMWYSGLNAKADFNLLGQMDPHRNRQGRHMLGPIFSMKSIRESESHMHDSLAAFKEVFGGLAGQNVNVVEYMNVLATGEYWTTAPALSFGEL